MVSKLSPNTGSIRMKAVLFFGLTFLSTIALFSILAPSAFTAWVEDPVLTTGQYIRAPHVTELRAAINAKRVAKGLSAYVWTDDPIVAGSTPVRGLHFEEMQTALLELYEPPWFEVPNFPDEMDETRPISLGDIQQLRFSVDTVGWVGDGLCQQPYEDCANSSDCRDNPCDTWVMMVGYACGADCPAGGPACGADERCYSQMCGSPTACQVYYSCQRNAAEVTQCNCGDDICNAPYENATECFADCGCGNSLINSGEQCDSANLNGASCASRGFSGGTLSCTGGCAFNTAGCYTCGNQTCETAKGENGSNCPHDCCDANTTCGSQGRPDGYNYCTGNLSSPLDGSSAGYAFVPDATIAGFCDNPAEAYTSNYTCNGTTYRCCNPMAGSIATKWSSGACGCNNNGVQDGDETGVDCGGANCAVCQSCGNNAQEGTEACDGSDLDGQDCISRGYHGGTLACSSCNFDQSGCFTCGAYGCEAAQGEDCANCWQDCGACPTPGCLDGTVDPGEDCDLANLNGQSCASLGYTGGTLACNNCSFDTSGCYTCPGNGCEASEDCSVCWQDCGACPTPGCLDGTVDPGEDCDLTNLNGQTCRSLGYPGGTLACSGGCSFDTSGCNTCDAASCGQYNPGWSCQCDSSCTTFGDCCSNKCATCGGC